MEEAAVDKCKVMVFSRTKDKEKEPMVADANHGQRIEDTKGTSKSKKKKVGGWVSWVFIFQ